MLVSFTYTPTSCYRYLPMFREFQYAILRPHTEESLCFRGNMLAGISSSPASWSTCIRTLWPIYSAVGELGRTAAFGGRFTTSPEARYQVLGHLHGWLGVAAAFRGSASQERAPTTTTATLTPVSYSAVCGGIEFSMRRKASRNASLCGGREAHPLH